MNRCLSKSLCFKPGFNPEECIGMKSIRNLRSTKANLYAKFGGMATVSLRKAFTLKNSTAVETNFFCSLASSTENLSVK